MWLLKWILWWIEWPYRLWMEIRNIGYTYGFFASSQPPYSYVVSIGNLSVGGSGKTPLTELLTQELLALDQTLSTSSSEEGSSPFDLAILSRGYHSRCEASGGHLIFHTAPYNALLPYLPSPVECGDEPCLLAGRLSGIWFGVGKNRLDLAKRLAKKGVRLFLLDDGFQHRRLARQCDIVLLDAEEPFANQHCLPRGPLREAPRALARASWIILYPVRDSAQFLRSCKHIAPYTKAPVIGMAPRVMGAYVVSVAKSPLQSIPLSALKGAKLALLCGIARPERFMETIESLGCFIVAQEILADHASFSPEQLMAFFKCAVERNAQYVLCTEKDAVKLSALEASLLTSLPLPLLFLRIQLHPVERTDEWDALVQAIYHQR